jgi:CRISPR-associated protein Csb2
MISVASEPIPEVLSGHRRDGSPSRRTHVAFLPLPFVDHRHANGHLVGLGLALPRDLGPAERATVLEALGRLTSGHEAAAGDGKLRLGSLGRWSLEALGAATMPWSLRSESWARPAAHWASVTPVVFDRFSDDPVEKRQIIADSCERIGLPRPAEVRFSHVSPFLGAPPSPEFGPLDRGAGRPVRPYTHVGLSFTDAEARPRPVGGPVLIGAGRYRGYGVLRPYDPRRSHPWTP